MLGVTRTSIGLGNPYTGPAVPIAWVADWNLYTNLTPAQVLAFQTFPQDLTIYAATRRWAAETTILPVQLTLAGNPVTLQVDMSDRGQARIDKLCRKWAANATATTQFVDTTGTVYALNAANLMALDNAVTNYIEALFTAYASNIAAINALTLTTRKGIDAVYAAIAPNSPSGLAPSLT